MSPTDIARRSKMLRDLDHREARIERTYAAQRLELREADDDPNLLSFTGYASVTDAPYEMYGGPANGGWMETIVRGAFAKTLADRADVAFLINHTGMTLARTKSGTLTLAEDGHGLAVEASLDGRQGPVSDLRIAMDRRDIDEMSFAFRIIRQQWLTADGEEVPWWDISGIDRRILEVSLQKGDVSVVNYGANPATSADLRFLLAEARAGRPISAASRAALLTVLGADDSDSAGEIGADPVEIEPPGSVVEAGMSLLQARSLELGLARH